MVVVLLDVCLLNCSKKGGLPLLIDSIFQRLLLKPNWVKNN